MASRAVVCSVLLTGLAGGGDAGDSAVGVHTLLAAVPDRHHLRRVSTQQARRGQLPDKLDHCNGVNGSVDTSWHCCCYSAPDRRAEYCDERVCLCVCVFVCQRSYLRNCTSDLYQFLCLLPMAVARSSSGGVMICYVFPVLWMTSYLHISCKVTPG